MRVLEPVSNGGPRGMIFAFAGATRRRNRTRLIGHGESSYGPVPHLQEEAFGPYRESSDGQSGAARITGGREKRGATGEQPSGIETHTAHTRSSFRIIQLPFGLRDIVRRYASKALP